MKFVVTLLLFALIGSCAQAQLDLSTDKGVKKFYCKKEGLAYDDLADDICVDRISGTNKVIVVGTFAHDAGCGIDAIIVNDKMGEWDEMIPKAFAAMNWNDAKSKKAFLLNFVTDMSMAWGSPISETNEDFESDETPAFSAIDITEDAGSFVVSYWVQNPPGMLPQKSYTKRKLTFSADGALTSSEKTEGFTVDLKRNKNK